MKHSIDLVLSQVVNDRLVTLFIVPNPKFPEGIPESTFFETRTYFEIGDIQWFPLQQVNHYSCYSARPFLPVLGDYIADFKRRQKSLIREKKRHEAEIKFKAESEDKVVFVTAEEMDVMKKKIEELNEMKKHAQTADFEFSSSDEKSITFTHAEGLKQRQTFCTHAECLKQKDKEELQNLDVKSDEYEFDEHYESDESYETVESNENAVTVVNVRQIADEPNKQNHKDRKEYQNVAVEPSSFKKEMVDVDELYEPSKLRDHDQLSTFSDDSLRSEDSNVNVGNMAEFEKNEQSDCDQNQPGLLSEDFLPNAWKSFTLDHDYLLHLSLYGAVAKRR